MPALLDERCRQVVERHPDAAVAWLLMAAYAYYVEDDPILSDGLFDRLCRDLAARWHQVRHPHAALLCREDLATGSLFALGEESYPPMAIGALRRLREEQQDVAEPAVKETGAPAQDQPAQLALF